MCSNYADLRNLKTIFLFFTLEALLSVANIYLSLESKNSLHLN